ncbi:MAG: hypothetical protein ACLP9S_13460 [Syntrophales bacterium]
MITSKIVMVRVSIDPAGYNCYHAEAATSPKIDYIVEYDRATDEI